LTADGIRAAFLFITRSCFCRLGRLAFDGGTGFPGCGSQTGTGGEVSSGTEARDRAVLDGDADSRSQPRATHNVFRRTDVAVSLTSTGKQCHAVSIDAKSLG
jgi:hypothetical protein